MMYPDDAKETIGRTLTPSRPSIMDQLLRQQEELTQRLVEVTNAIGALKANPELADVIEKLGKLGGLRL